MNDEDDDEDDDDYDERIIEFRIEFTTTPYLLFTLCDDVQVLNKLQHWLLNAIREHNKMISIFWRMNKHHRTHTRHNASTHR